MNTHRKMDHSMQSLRFSRTTREAGWHDEAFDDDAPTGAAIVWGLALALVAVVVLVVVWLWP